MMSVNPRAQAHLIAKPHSAGMPHSSRRRIAWLLPLAAAFVALVAIGGSNLMAMTPQGVPPWETWSYGDGETKNLISNNQNPDNYIVKNNAGSDSIAVTVYDSDDNVVDGPYELGPNEQTGHVGVGMGQRLEVEDLNSGNGKGISGGFREA